MTVEVLEKFDIDSVQDGNLPSYWDDKPVALGLHKSYLQLVKNFIELTYSWINGISISNAEGKNLDDIGYEYNVLRSGMTDDDYRLAILVKMSSYSDSGTTTDVIRFVKGAFKANFVDIIQYPATRFAIMRVEGTAIDTRQATTINQKVSSGSRVEVIWEFDNNTFVPSCLITQGLPENLLATLPSGTDNIGVVLENSLVDTLGYNTTDNEIVYFSDPWRSVLLQPLQDIGLIVESPGGSVITNTTNSGQQPMAALLDYSLQGLIFPCLILN